MLGLSILRLLILGLQIVENCTGSPNQSIFESKLAPMATIKTTR